MASIIITGLTPEEVELLVLAAQVAGTPLDGEGTPIWAEYLGVRKLIATAKQVAFSVTPPQSAEPDQASETETHDEVNP